MSSGEVSQLLQKAKSSKLVESWDDDFECESDALFRSSLSSTNSSQDGPISIVGESQFTRKSKTHSNSQAFRNGSKLSTNEYLNSFREEDDDDNSHDMTSQTIRDTTNKLSKLALQTPSPKKPAYNMGTITKSNEESTTLTKRQKGSVRNNNSLQKWSEDLEGGIDDSEFNVSMTPTYQNTYFKTNEVATLRARQKEGNDISSESSIVKGTFFQPPSRSFSKSSPTKQVEQPSITHLQRRRSKKASSNSNLIPEEDFESGFEDEDLNQIDTSNISKFSNSASAPPPLLPSNQHPSYWEEDSLTGDNTNSTRRDSLFSHTTSTNTESEVDGEDFFDGVVLPDTPIDFKLALKMRQQEAAREEQNQHLPNRKVSGSSKYDTVKSNHSSISDDYAYDAAEEADDEMDILKGFEISGDDDDGFLIKSNTLHNNVKIKNAGPSINKRSALANSPTKKQRFPQSTIPSRNFSSLSPSKMDRLRSKKSMPVLRSQKTVSADYTFGTQKSLQEQLSMLDEERLRKQEDEIVFLRNRHSSNGKPSPQVSTRKASNPLRHYQSMMSLNEGVPLESSTPKPHQTSSPKSKPSTRFSKAHTGKILGDGTELDDLEDLSVDVDQELSFTVKPVANSKTVGRHRNNMTIGHIMLSKFKFIFIYYLMRFTY